MGPLLLVALSIVVGLLCGLGLAQDTIRNARMRRSA